MVAPEYEVGHGAVVTAKSRGVQQMEAMHSRLSTKWRILLYSGFTLLAYVMSLSASTFPSFAPFGRSSLSTSTLTLCTSQTSTRRAAT